MSKINIIWTIWFATIILFMNGCTSSIKIKAGVNTDFSLLESKLIAGSSTREDVLAALGIPHGKGRAMLPIDEAPRTLWSYYYEEDTISLAGGESKGNFKYLLIYFKDNIYDGYMWFSTFVK